MTQFDMNMCDFPFERPDTLLDLACIFAQRIDGVANVTQVLQNDIVRLGHGQKLSCRQRHFQRRCNLSHVGCVNLQHWIAFGFVTNFSPVSCRTKQRRPIPIRRCTPGSPNPTELRHMISSRNILIVASLLFATLADRITPVNAHGRDITSPPR
jgi:hypothetical protein